MSEIYTLSNGVRLVVDPMPGLESAALGVWAYAGSVDERDDEQGLAHLLEHMAFKGTTRRTARGIAEEIEAVGGYLNAGTSHQRTGYYARVLKNDAPLALDILADILHNPLFDNGELTKEKEVVTQEIGEAADTPDDVVFEMLMQAAWDGHPLARPILGTPETVRAQSPASLRGFMDRLYMPSSMVIAVAGAVDAKTLAALVEEHFGAAKPKPSAPARTTPQWRGGARHDARAIEQTHLALAFPGAAARDEDFFATRIFADILGGGMSSRLFQSIREERGLAYSVYAFADGYEHCGLTGVYVGADASQTNEAARLIRTEMEAMTTNVTQVEIDRTRAMLRASMLMSLESPAARIEAAAGQLFTYGEILTPASINARLDAVTTDDVRRCALHALEGGAPALAMVGAGDMAAVEAIVGGGD